MRWTSFICAVVMSSKPASASAAMTRFSSDRYGMNKQTAGFLVDQLEKVGWVERRPDPTDRRARLVCISERGRRAVPVATAAGRAGVERVPRRPTDA
jgi:DNA-binding MarR family transcriptional regulator